MDIRKKRIRGYFVLSVLVILCLCFVSAVSIFVPNYETNAICDTSNIINIGNLLLSGYENQTSTSKNIFNGSQLSILYQRLTGKQNATYSDIVSDAKVTRDSAYFRSKNSNKN